MTIPWTDPSPSLEIGPPNPQGEGRLTGDQTHTTEGTSRRRKTAQDAVSAATRRRRLVAIARDRAAEVELTPLHELWAALETGWWRCGWSTLYRNTGTGTVVGLPDHCDKLACPYCEMRRVAKVRDRYRLRHDAVLAERRLYLVTLTIPNVLPGELAGSLARLRKAIARLRRRRWWDEAVVGGLWRLEVTINMDTRTWHPHANLLFETRRPIRMADWQPRLQAEWRAVLGETTGQWIWLLPGWSGTLPETVKRQVAMRDGSSIGADDGASSVDYAVKRDPHWIDPSDPGWVVEYVEALARSRSVSSFGAWRGLPRPKPERTEATIEAPYGAGDDFFARRELPTLDPLTSTYADWEFIGRGPRWALRPHKPPGEHRQEWLVWHPNDGTVDPTWVDEDTPLRYQARLPLGPPARA